MAFDETADPERDTKAGEWQPVLGGQTSKLGVKGASGEIDCDVIDSRLDQRAELFVQPILGQTVDVLDRNDSHDFQLVFNGFNMLRRPRRIKRTITGEKSNVSAEPQHSC